jgi:hypothetical protein
VEKLREKLLFIFTCHIWNMREVLVSCRDIADFHVLGLFMAKKHDLSEQKISVCHAPLPPLLDEICLDTSSVPMKAKKLKFWLP